MKKFFATLYEHIEYFLVAFIFLSVFFLAKPTFSSAPLSRPKVTDYTSSKKLFNQERVHRIDVWLKNEDWDNLLETAAYKTKYHADVRIDGDYFEDVAFSARGNASLTELSRREDFTRFSYKINFSKFNSGKTYFGLDELVLNNLYADPSGLRDFLSFEIMRAAGVETPLTSYTEVFVNNERVGLYLAVEEVDRSFLTRNGNSKDSSLFKPEALACDRHEILLRSEVLPNGEADLGLNYDSTSPEFDYEGADLRYVGDAPESYEAIFRNAVTKVSARDRERIIEAIKSLETGENLEEFWDIDELVKYFAAHNFVQSGDSYTGFTAHNYFLKLSDGKVSFLPWDYNLAFQNLWLNEEDMTVYRVYNWGIDKPLIGPSVESRPAWRIIVENEEYLEKYHLALQNLLDEFIVSGDCLEKLEKTYALIRPHLVNDWKAFYPAEEMDEGIEYLKFFLYYRSDSVQRQLWGITDLAEE